MAKDGRKNIGQRTESSPTPISRKLDGHVAATGSNYPGNYFTNPWNNGIDAQYGGHDDGKDPGETRTLYSPTSTPVGMGALSLHSETSYDSNWECGVRGSPYSPRRGRK